MEKLAPNPSDIQNIHLNSTLDVRAEVIITELIRNGVKLEDLIFQLNGTLNRAHRKDILEFKTNTNQSSKIDIVLSREGLYDYLPQSLFFPLNESSRRSSASEMTDNVRKNNQIEEDARKFFAPLDTFFSHIRIEAEREARSLNEGGGINNQGPLGIIWELPANLKTHERNLLILLLPFTRQIVASNVLLSGFFSLFFNTPFQVNVSSTVEKVDYCESLNLSDSFLGYSSVLGGDIKSEHTIISLEYQISDQKELEEFKPGSRFDELIDFLSSFFLPLECLYLKQPRLNQLLPQMSLGTEAHYILDYSAYLSD